MTTGLDRFDGLWILPSPSTSGAGAIFLEIRERPRATSISIAADDERIPACTMNRIAKGSHARARLSIDRIHVPNRPLSWQRAGGRDFGSRIVGGSDNEIEGYIHANEGKCNKQNQTGAAARLLSLYIRGAVD